MNKWISSRYFDAKRSIFETFGKYSSLYEVSFLDFLNETIQFWITVHRPWIIADFYKTNLTFCRFLRCTLGKCLIFRHIYRKGKFSDLFKKSWKNEHQIVPEFLFTMYFLSPIWAPFDKYTIWINSDQSHPVKFTDSPISRAKK